MPSHERRRQPIEVRPDSHFADWSLARHFLLRTSVSVVAALFGKGVSFIDGPITDSDIDHDTRSGVSMSTNFGQRVAPDLKCWF